MKNEESFFKRFVYNGEFVNRDSLRKPFERDGYIYATNSRVMVRVAKNLCEESYKQQEHPKKLPTFSAGDCCYKLDLKELVEVLKSIPSCETVAVSGKDAECDECEGYGRVEWTYENTNGEEHRDYFDCPICDGKGKVATKEFYREERSVSINGVPFNAGLLCNIAEAMNDIGLQSAVVARLEKGSQPMLIQFQDGIDVIIMPSGVEPYREMKLEDATTKLP